MVAQLTTFAKEVTRVALEVGTEGKLGGQAVVYNVEGVWKALTDSASLPCLRWRHVPADLPLIEAAFAFVRQMSTSWLSTSLLRWAAR